MKALQLKLTLALLTAAFAINLNAQETYEIATWYGFRTAAVSYTFDDNCSKQLTNAMPVFDNYDYKVTFYPVVDWSPNWDGFKAACENGHEIGSHTVSHATLNQLTAKALIKELSESQTTVREETGSECYSISYPNCNKPSESKLAPYYISGRTCSGKINATSPSDFYEISAVIVGSKGINTAELLNSQVSSTIDVAGWNVFLMHGVDSDAGSSDYSPVSSTVLASHLEYINSHDSEVWVATFANVSKYINERNCATITEDIITSDSIRVNIADTLQDTLYNAAITIRRALPGTWTNGGVIINGKLAESTVSTIDGTKYITFNAVPDQDVVYLLNADIITSVEEQLKDKIKVFPNPFTSELNLKLMGNFSYQIFSIEGKLLEQGASYNNSVIGKELNDGIYILSVSQTGLKYSQTIIKQ